MVGEFLFPDMGEIYALKQVKLPEVAQTSVNIICQQVQMIGAQLITYKP